LYSVKYSEKIFSLIFLLNQQSPDFVSYNMSGQSLSLALEEEAKLLNLLEDEIEADSQTQIAAHEIRTLLIKEKNQ
ncbi:hypothetical protein ACI3RH_12620, partial [Lactococcus lactis]